MTTFCHNYQRYVNRINNNTHVTSIDSSQAKVQLRKLDVLHIRCCDCMNWNRQSTVNTYIDCTKQILDTFGGHYNTLDWQSPTFSILNMVQLQHIFHDNLTKVMFLGRFVDIKYHNIDFVKLRKEYLQLKENKYNNDFLFVNV